MVTPILTKNSLKVSLTQTLRGKASALRRRLRNVQAVRAYRSLSENSWWECVSSYFRRTVMCPSPKTDFPCPMWILCSIYWYWQSMDYILFGAVDTGVDLGAAGWRVDGRPPRANVGFLRDGGSFFVGAFLVDIFLTFNINFTSIDWFNDKIEW